jgi:hypothetical protein
MIGSFPIWNWMFLATVVAGFESLGSFIMDIPEVCSNNPNRLKI